MILKLKPTEWGFQRFRLKMNFDLLRVSRVKCIAGCGDVWEAFLCTKYYWFNAIEGTVRVFKFENNCWSEEEKIKNNNTY